MPVKWIKTKFPGVRSYDHPKRKHGVKFDRYFAIRYQRDGKRKEEGLGWASEGMTQEKAALQLAELKQAHTTGSGSTRLTEKRQKAEDEKKAEEMRKAQEAIENITFSEFFTNNYFPIAKEDKKPESSRKESEHFEKWLEPVLGDRPLRNISPLNLEKVKKDMIKAKRSPRLIQYVFATFRQCWNKAKRDGVTTTESPTKQVKLPKVENRRLRFLTHDEAESLLDGLKKRSQQVHDMALLSLHTGVRAGEVFSLTWGLVDIENDTMLIRDAKGQPRHTFLTDETRTMLLNRFNGQLATDFVFKDNKGQQIKKISKTYNLCITDLGFNDGVEDRRDKVIFHTLRHTFASWHVQNGTDLYELKELLGHSTIQLTERYSHLRPEGLKKTAKRFNNFIKKKPENKTVIEFNNNNG